MKAQYLWQVAIVSAGTSTVAGELFDKSGRPMRYSVTIGSAAKQFKQAVIDGGGIWDNPVALSILSVSGSSIYVNLGANQDGTMNEAPTSANETIAADGEYQTNPIYIEART